MEHSLLHGVQLCGLIFALGGTLFRFLVLSPALRHYDPSDQNASGREIEALVSRWIARLALAAASGAIIDIFVQVAEIDGRTIYGGVSMEMVLRYLVATTVGNIATTKTILLITTAFIARRNAHSWILLLLLLGAALASTMVSHSAAAPEGRAMAIAAQFVHIAGAAFWLGMLAFVFLATIQLARVGGADTELLAALVNRFSPYALASVILISLSGVYTSFRFIVSPWAILVSAYGLTLLLKLLLLSFVVYAGFLNWRSIRPFLPKCSGEKRTSLQKRFLRLLELELSAGVLLILVAGILGAISPPSELGSAQLNPAQTAALLQPRLPPGHFVDPTGFVGAATRTNDDLRYAEFTHQWSGVFVILLGICWLGQSISVRGNKAFAWSWPALLIPFGIFISAIADPEVWILQMYSFREVLRDPQVLEHQIGALLVFVLAVLGLRDSKRQAELRPLGYVFPVLIIAGSLMLLGHAHSNLGISEELSNLINMQHAVIGGFGLIAGACRWFQIRRLPGASSFRVIWPSSILLLGVFMAFFYRELMPVISNSLALR